MRLLGSVKASLVRTFSIACPSKKKRYPILSGGLLSKNALYKRRVKWYDYNRVMWEGMPTGKGA